MTNIGITGQKGFIGNHLSMSIDFIEEDLSLINFERSWFENETSLDDFVEKCDVIIHLAGLNRHENQDVIYETNIEITKKLVQSLERTNSPTTVLFASSIQENFDNKYGKSKKISRQLLEEWGSRTKNQVTTFIIPNVFGPFCKPFYNSVVATFCFQLTHKEQPKIINDATVDLIFIKDVTDRILNEVKVPSKKKLVNFENTHSIKVSEILTYLESFKNEYFENSVIPCFNNDFEINLFNTYRSYIDLKSHFPIDYTVNQDSRGKFVEIIRLETGGQISFSTTNPGITRGNHFHTRKIERFAVIQGKALIQMRKVDSNETFDFEIFGSSPGFVDMPIWFTHNLINIGDEELITIFWINEFYNPEDPDTFYLDVNLKTDK